MRSMAKPTFPKKTRPTQWQALHFNINTNLLLYKTKLLASTQMGYLQQISTRW